MSPLKSPAASTSPDIQDRIGARNVPSPTPSITRTGPGKLAGEAPIDGNAPVTAFVAGAAPVENVVLAPVVTPDVGAEPGTATLLAGVATPFAVAKLPAAAAAAFAAVGTPLLVLPVGTTVFAGATNPFTGAGTSMPTLNL